MFEFLMCCMVAAGASQRYEVDTQASVVDWLGTKFRGLGRHSGVVRVARGDLELHQLDLVGGTIVIDMTTIEVTDIPPTDPVPRNRLGNHLKDQDFFDVRRYPTASLRIVSSTRQDSAYDISADLTMRGITRRLRFPARLDRLGNGHLRATGELRFNRHDWGVSFRGSRLTNDLVDDDIVLTLRVVARRQEETPAQSLRTFPECEWCGAAEAPRGLGNQMNLAPGTEPGELLVLEGTIYEADGHTPARNVLLYAYQTNAAGVYPRRGNETGAATRHGYLRGWLRTDATGRYRITTIKPGQYPGRTDPAHIHMTVTPGNGPERWVEEIIFAGDTRITPEQARKSSCGGKGIVNPTRNRDGQWYARRDIVVPQAAGCS